MRSWIDIATLAHTKNLNGGLVARSASGLPFLLEEGMEIALVPPVLDAPRNVRVASVAMRSDTEALVFFDEVTDADTAKCLVGCHCLARQSEVDLGVLEPEEELPAWEGFGVYDARAGFVGEVVSVDERPMQPLLVVARPGGSQVLVPLVDEFVAGFDEQTRRIDLDCPDGLLEL